MPNPKSHDPRHDPHQLAQSKEPAQVRRMFHEIAPTYDFLNRLLSAGIDARWRKKMARQLLARPGVAMALDVCCGTGDLAVALRREGARRGSNVRVVGSDFTPSMMARGHQKMNRFAGRNAASLVGDTMRLPFATHEFDLVTVAFGIRNVSDFRAGLAEMVRVCRPGGQVAILEFSHPRLPGIRQMYDWYFNQVLPRIGAALTRTSAYRYLPTSVAGFPDTPEFAAALGEIAGGSVSAQRLTFGIATLYIADIPQ